MKGKFTIEEIVAQPLGEAVLFGTVSAGRLKKGMESVEERLVIADVRDAVSDEVLDTAKRGGRVRLLTDPVPLERLQVLKGKTITFEDFTTIPLKDSLLLRPRPVSPKPSSQI